MKIYLDMVGCRLNQAEIEQFARQFRSAGHELVPEANLADLTVINTCAVTAAAASDSRHKIRHALQAGSSGVAVTGCWATLNPNEAMIIPGVVQVVPNLEKDRLVANLLQTPDKAFDLEPIERQQVPDLRLRTRSFIKVQDGCDNHCTFCVTTIARGPGRSRTIPEVLADIHGVLGKNHAGDDGAQEIVLSGVHLGSWGYDFTSPARLAELVQEILDKTDVSRLRLSSLEPWDLDDKFFDLWRDPRLCRHLHLPLQSGSAATLRRMARKTTPRAFSDLVIAARNAIPGVAITTDIITGFPGESDAEFEEGIELVKGLHFAGGHVFTYSARPGTAAARLPDQVPLSLRKQRNTQMRLALVESAQHYQVGFLNQVLPVLWESAVALGPQGWLMSGLTDNYLRVRTVAPRSLWNQITPVRLSTAANGELIGQLV
jgi:threonylcarbamoyladenosine tRNA methylthiotransferase MtaB